MSHEIDRRYVELIAQKVALVPKKYLLFYGLGCIIAFAGFLMVISGEATSIIALVPIILGIFLAGLGSIQGERVKKASVKRFLEEFDNTGQLPPYPEK